MSDNKRNTVTLTVKGPGYLEQVLDANGDGVSLNLVGMVPHRTTLKGHIKARRGSSGQTEIGPITGLGQFGDVKVLHEDAAVPRHPAPVPAPGKYVL